MKGDSIVTENGLQEQGGNVYPQLLWNEQWEKTRNSAHQSGFELLSLTPCRLTVLSFLRILSFQSESMSPL